MLDLFSKLQFKKDPWLFALAVVLVAAAGACIHFKLVTAREAGGFLLAAFTLPGFFGKSNGSNGDGGTTSGGSSGESTDTTLPPPRTGSLRVAMLVATAMTLTGCAWLQKHGPDLVLDLAEKSACALARMNLPEDQIWADCGIHAEDIPRILPLLKTARTEAAHEAANARADEHALMAAKVHCRDDAGAP